jgi:hypothetical protein
MNDKNEEIRVGESMLTTKINSTSNANAEEVDNTQLNENDTTTEKEPLCFKIYYNFENPNDSKIELCDAKTSFDGGKTQKKKRSLKPLKRKTIHKKLKFRKTPKKKHPRRRSIRK